MKKVFIRGEHNYDVDEASRASGLLCPEESLTRQSFAEEADINTLVRRFGLTGQMPNQVAAPSYGDFTEVVDYQTALNAVLHAEDAFMALPGEVRARFHNDPQELLEFVSDDRNRGEAEKLGLVVAKPPAASADPGKGSEGVPG